MTRYNAEHPLSQQVGGDHYKHFPIQPLEFMIANNIPGAEAHVIKYVVRHKLKNGVEDLKKARHILDVLIASYDEPNKPGPVRHLGRAQRDSS